MSENTLSQVLLYGEQVQNIHDALVASGYHELANMLATKAQRSPIEFQFIEAMPRLDENVFSVDEQPVVSVSEGGAYVMIWHWVSNADADIK